MSEAGLNYPAKQKLLCKPCSRSKRGQLQDGAAGKKGSHVSDHEVDQLSQSSPRTSKSPAKSEEDRQSGSQTHEKRKPGSMELLQRREAEKSAQAERQ